MAEWSNAAVLKTVEGHTSGGSNPSFSAKTLTLLLGFLYLVMKLYKYIFLFILISLSFSSAQTDNNSEGTKIDLNNVDVETKALPTVLLFGKQFLHDHDCLIMPYSWLSPLYIRQRSR